MNEITVNKKNFEDSLAKIEKASEENKNLPELKRFDEKGGLFKLFPKNVTGQEMNDFTKQVGDNLIIVNDKINNFYKQFTDIYNAFETLDKEYIAGIVGAFNQSVEATKKAEAAQADIKTTLELLGKTVEELKSFNDKVSAELQKHKLEFELLENKTSELIKEVESYREQYNDLVKQLEEYKKEKIRNNKMLIVFNISFIVMCIAIITMIVVLAIKL